MSQWWSCEPMLTICDICCSSLNLSGSIPLGMQRRGYNYLIVFNVQGSDSMCGSVLSESAHCVRQSQTQACVAYYFFPCMLKV